MKRKVAAVAAAVLVASLAAGVLVLRTPWAASRVCALAETRVRATTGLELAVGACQFDPVALEVTVREVRLGPRGAPVFTADAVRARLSTLQLGRHHLDLAEVEVLRPRVVATIPATVPGSPALACPPTALQQLGVRQLAVREGSLDLTFPGGDRLTVARVDIRSGASTRGRLAALAKAVARRASVGVVIASARVEAQGYSVGIDEATLEADVALDLSRADVHLATAELPGASIVATGSIEQLCRPRLDLAASAEGDLRSLLALLGRAPEPVEGRVAVDAKITGSATALRAEGDLRLSQVAIEAWRPGDATAHVRLAGNELRIDDLDVPTLGGRVAARGVVRLGKEIRLDAEATLHHVELGEIFARLALPGAWVMARLDGTARVTGTAFPLQLRGEAGLDVSEFRVLDHRWDRYRAGEATFLDVPRARVDGNVRIDRSGVRIETARVRAGDGTVATTAMLHFDGRRGFEVAYEGTVDLRHLRHLGPMPVSGVARVEGGLVKAAPYGNPHVEGRIAVRETSFLQLDLGEATARVSYDDFVLHIEGIEGRRGVTRYDGSVTLALGKHPSQVTAATYRAEGRLRDLFEATMRWQPNAVHARDALDGDVVLHGTAHGPVTALEATFGADLGRGELAGRRFDGGRVAGRVEGGARAVFDVAELRRSGGVVRASGRVGFDAPFPWELDGSFSALHLEDLGLPGSGWAGTIAGTATVRGSYEDPRVDVSATGSEVAVSNVRIGAAGVAFHLAGTSLSASGDADGVKFAGTALTTGGLPYQARADIDMEDALRYLPGGSPAGLTARIRGMASASGKLAEIAASRAEIQLDEVRGAYGDFRVDSAAPVVLSLADGRVIVRSFTMRGASTQFAVTGTREPSGSLALDARGTLDVRLLAGLLPGVADPRGQMLIEAHVGGTVVEPLLVGSGKLRDAAFRVRDLPVAFTGITGDVAFSQNRMLFDRLAATVNGGRADLDGEVELVRFLPTRVRVGAQLEEVPVRIPEWLPSVVSGRLQAAGTRDAMLISGKLHVVRALYVEPVDLEKRLVEVQRKKAVTKPFDRSGGWVSLDVALAVDGDARIENDVARGGLKGDLTLTGTLASVGLVGTLTMTPGSRGTFRGNEFVLSHAVVDFTDRRKVRMSLDVHGEAQVRDYQVFMHVFGPYEDPTLNLTTQPALSQHDIVTLLSLGYTTRDTAAAGGVTGVATAAAAQALFTASGLDDQVRRFVPRGKLLRDFNVRITSAYSEGAGQVMPRAEFESKVLDERFRLRYQAPLAGARGQRAQAEMRLGTHTSVQYQWDNDSPDVSSGGDHGVDLKLRWDWTE